MEPQIHILIDEHGNVSYDRFDSGAMLYTIGDVYYRRVHVVYPGPAAFVYPARGLPEADMPYGPYEWIHYRHPDNPELVLPPGAQRV